jgi:predicted membrane protein
MKGRAMNAKQVEVSGAPTIKAFQNYGSVYGFLLGSVIGVLLAGPNFDNWTWFQSVSTILGSGIVLGIIGHFATAVFCGVGAADTTDHVIPSPNEAVTANDIGD